jgi:hypothetical protein
MIKSKVKADRAAAARAALAQKFVDQANGDPVKAERLRRAFYRGLARESARVRGRKAAARRRAREAALDAEVPALRAVGVEVMSQAEFADVMWRDVRTDPYAG